MNKINQLILLCVLLLLTAMGSATAQDRAVSPARKTIPLKNGKAKSIPAGPFQPSWESIKQNYTVPEWFKDAKFGIFIHYGVYTVPAYASEWYPMHMYSNPGVQKWHVAHFGPVDQFGYKDFIPMFKMAQFDATAWSELFRKSGAKYVVPTAEHHDGFAMYDSDLTHWDAREMGPRLDFIGQLAQAVRKQGLKFGVSNHRMEHWDFMYPKLETKSDLFDPAYAEFYGPPQPPTPRKPSVNGEEVLEDQAVAPQSKAFLEEWLARCQELVDKYKPDMFWFDNGINSRMLDSVKLRFAAYYYNRAHQWGKPVSISTKSDAYLAGSIKDFERQGRAPKMLTDFTWQVDDPIGHKFGYVDGLQITPAPVVIRRLIENVSRNGNLLLNISPKSDGSIPDDQQAVLLSVGKWLARNGEAIYGTRAWKKSEEGIFRFTQKGNTLYAIAVQWSQKPVKIAALAQAKGQISAVKLLGSTEKIAFRQDTSGVEITFPEQKTEDAVAWAFKIEGLDLK